MSDDSIFLTNCVQTFFLFSQKIFEKRGIIGRNFLPILRKRRSAGNRLARRWAREPRPYEKVAWAAVRGRAGRPGGRPLRKRILWCVGEGLCPSRGRGRTPPLRITRSAVKRGDVGIGPYGGVTRSAMGGRPQGSPLRRVTRGAVRRVDRGVRPYGDVTSSAVKRGVGDAAPYGGVTRSAMGGQPQGSPLRMGYKRCGVRRDTWVPPYSRAFYRAGPACPAVSAAQDRRADRGVRPYGDVYVFLSAHRKTPGMAPAFQVWVLCACGAARHHLYICKSV